MWSLGAWVDGLGDFNADGYDDIVISAAEFLWDGPGVEGIVFVYPGSPAGITDTSFSGTILRVRGNTEFGHFVAGAAGDVNGDGGADMSAENTPWEEYDGAAYLYHGAPVVVPTLGAGGLVALVLALGAAAWRRLGARG